MYGNTHPILRGHSERFLKELNYVFNEPGGSSLHYLYQHGPDVCFCARAPAGERRAAPALPAAAPAGGDGEGTARLLARLREEQIKPR